MGELALVYRLGFVGINGGKTYPAGLEKRVGCFGGLG